MSRHGIAVRLLAAASLIVVLLLLARRSVDFVYTGF